MLNAILAALAPHIPEIATILAGVIVTGLMLLLRAASQAVRQWGAAHGQVALGQQRFGAGVELGPAAQD